MHEDAPLTDDLADTNLADSESATTDLADPADTTDAADTADTADTADPETVYGPGEDEMADEASADEDAEADDEGPFHNTIHIRNLSIKCGHCLTYQTLCSFTRQEEWNVYTYECENDTCDPEVTRTLVEVPAELDEFARRDPGWRGGRIHAGAE